MLNILIAEIQIIPVKPQNGLVAFASFVLNNQFYVGNIAIYTSPSSRNGFRLLFSDKKSTSGKSIKLFHPITEEAGEKVTSEIVKEYVKLMANFYRGQVL